MLHFDLSFVYILYWFICFVIKGGAGFYTSDISNKDRMFEVRKEKVLLLDCLGPPESDWNMQSFQVCSGNFDCLHLKSFWISS
jgi:hypothetical protein